MKIRQINPVGFFAHHATGAKIRVDTVSAYHVVADMIHEAGLTHIQMIIATAKMAFLGGEHSRVGWL
jgi:hypothetical protein